MQTNAPGSRERNCVEGIWWAIHHWLEKRKKNGKSEDTRTQKKNKAKVTSHKERSFGWRKRHETKNVDRRGGATKGGRRAEEGKW